jgi:G2/mitotic-specific cyclin 3/4
MLECLTDPRKHHNAIYDKYADKRYKSAAIFTETEIQRGYRFPSVAQQARRK